MDTLFTKTSFFTIFKRIDAIFSQFSKETTQFFHHWSGTGPLHNFGRKMEKKTLSCGEF